MASKDSSEPAEQHPQPAEQHPQPAEQLPLPGKQHPQLAELEEEMDTKAATQSDTPHTAHGNTHTLEEVDLQPQPTEESQAPGDVCMDVCMAGDPWTEDRRAPPADLGDDSEDSDRYWLFHTVFLLYSECTTG